MEIQASDYGNETWWEGYNNGTKIYESTHYVFEWQIFLSLNWPGVDEVQLKSSTYNHFIVDDLTYTKGTVPEAGATLALLGLGLAGLRALRCKA
ncbi:MAG TPA: PEP-CTERM sorting domain-containing protein [Candidatus Paceibacterota bacterium]|nr:PEP-CTERM sorting domain-containing protein [Verrucomicrobiota bacterium]HRY48942.1 PEP-CTERM sorting domain-containing protein [Candidatus Paceibacterota bacterium]HSA03887.1 PEP-CTERM sorting domain-containing protein [Candidatus Paceibacterota bacterium]